MTRGAAGETQQVRVAGSERPEGYHVELLGAAAQRVPPQALAAAREALHQDACRWRKLSRAQTGPAAAAAVAQENRGTASWCEKTLRAAAGEGDAMGVEGWMGHAGGRREQGRRSARV